MVVNLYPVFAGRQLSRVLTMQTVFQFTGRKYHTACRELSKPRLERPLSFLLIHGFENPENVASSGDH